MNTEHNIELEPLLDAKAVQKLLGISRAFVYRLADRGQLPCVRWESEGHTKSVVRFKLSDVKAFIEANYQKST